MIKFPSNFLSFNSIAKLYSKDGWWIERVIHVAWREKKWEREREKERGRGGRLINIIGLWRTTSQLPSDMRSRIVMSHRLQHRWSHAVVGSVSSRHCADTHPRARMHARAHHVTLSYHPNESRFRSLWPTFLLLFLTSCFLRRKCGRPLCWHWTKAPMETLSLSLSLSLSLFLFLTRIRRVNYTRHTLHAFRVVNEKLRSEKST